MADPNIAEAITLFEHSQTATSGPYREWAGLIVVELDELYRLREVGYREYRIRPGGFITGGDWSRGREGYDLGFNKQLIDEQPEQWKLPALSLTLVHEGSHAVADFDDDLTRLPNEVLAREVEISYYRELTGPGVFNEFSDPPPPGGRFQRVKLPNSFQPEYDEQGKWHDKRQLVDYVVCKLGDTYRDESYIYPEWIKANHQLWGGLKNRWPTTKGFYLKALVAQGPAASFLYTDTILLILESAPVGNRPHWDEMMRVGGPPRRIQAALDPSDLYSNRIARLEKAWKVTLME